MLKLTSGFFGFLGLISTYLCFFSGLISTYLWVFRFYFTLPLGFQVLFQPTFGFSGLI